VRSRSTLAESSVPRCRPFGALSQSQACHTVNARSLPDIPGLTSPMAFLGSTLRGRSHTVPRSKLRPRARPAPNKRLQGTGGRPSERLQRH
jgi:hypothetical protein